MVGSSSSEGHCTVGQIHSCSEVKPHGCGEGLRGIQAPRVQAGAWVVACDSQQDYNPLPTSVGLLMTLGKGITCLYNAFCMYPLSFGFQKKPVRLVVNLRGSAQVFFLIAHVR